MRIIGYERVSTARQGASGLGLEAQRQAIGAYALQRGANLIPRFTEVESGRNADRPELKKALHLAKVTGATLQSALDRRSPSPPYSQVPQICFGTLKPHLWYSHLSHLPNSGLYLAETPAPPFGSCTWSAPEKWSSLK